MAVLTLQYILFGNKSKELLKADFKKILYAVGGLIGLLILIYVMMDYSSWIDRSVLMQYTDPKTGDNGFARAIVAGMKADRKGMFGGQLLRTIGFAALVLGCLYLYMRNVIKPMVIAVALAAITIIDLLVVDQDYLNADNYISPDELTSQNFVPNSVDQQISQDRNPDYRVFNNAPGWTSESRTSYFHKSIGGYHPAKLSIYQDLIDKYFSQGVDQNILNMLNVRYIIYTDQKTNVPQLAPNPYANGSCWLVKSVKLVQGPVQELQDIGTTHLKDTAIVQQSFSSQVVQPQWDSLATIKLAKFDNDTMRYSFNSSKPQFAIFSEVYYPFGWNAYIDGKKTAYCKADYVLRGLSIPAGQHSIEFIFEPSTFKRSVNIAYIASFLILIFFVGGIVMQLRRDKVKTTVSS